MFGARPLPRTLEAALRDRTAEKAEVRAGALRDLVAHDGEAHEQVVRALQRALREDEAADVRAVAATALADLKAGEALPELLFAVEDAAPYVRQMAIAALGEIGDSRATERLRRALADERAEVRFQAVMAFPRVSADRKGALDAILRATTDADPFVCHIALRMTEELCDGGSPDERVLARARAILGDAGKSAEVHVAAAILLARTGDARAVTVLTQVVRGEIRTRDAEDEAAAIEPAASSGSRRPRGASRSAPSAASSASGSIRSSGTRASRSPAWATRAPAARSCASSATAAATCAPWRWPPPAAPASSRRESASWPCAAIRPAPTRPPSTRPSR